MNNKITRIRDLQGLGPASEKMLTEAGIETVEQLRELGALRAFVQVSNHRSKPPSVNLLYALAGALEETHWLNIARKQKGELLLQLDGYRDFKRDEIKKSE